ncbi:MFS transporter [Marinimicrococcus flavescens]|uniref:MFS transporter n=1 Tax=Marinimicrococcus flavescens TaxID=3031815 RepID=A0AAP3UYI3_9PROT|nr:MFS transporter [Marinimicrococcus flavescens]
MATRVEGASPAAGGDVKVTALITSAHFFSHFYILALPPLFGLLSTELGVSVAALGLGLAVLNVTTALSQPPIGFLVDRIGPAAILIVGHTAFAVAIGLLGLFPTYPALLALMVLAGLGNAVYHPADYAVLAARVSPGRIGRAFSIHTFGGYLGFAMAPPVMVALTAWLGWQTALLVTGIAGLAVSLALLASRSDLSARERAPARKPQESTRTDMRLLMSRPVLLSLLFFLMLAISHSGFTAFGVVVLQRLYGFDLATASLPLTVYLVVSALGVLAGGWVADRFGRHGLVVGLSSLVIGVAAGLFALFDMGLWPIVALFLVAGFFSGLIAPSRDMLVRQVTPPGASGKVFGFVMVGFNIGGLIAPPLYGLLVDLEMLRLVFWLVAIFSLLTIATIAGTGPAARRGEA